MRSKLIAIIVSFNRHCKLQQSVEICLANGVDKVIVVDNNSNEQVISYLSSIDDPRVLVQFNESNLGASKAFYLGIKLLPKICDIKSSKVVFLDDDAYVTPRFKEQVIKLKEGFIVPRVTDKAGNLLRMNLPLMKAPSKLRDILLYLVRRPVPRSQERCFVEVASFVGLTMNADVAFDKKHLIPRDFFIYFDDVVFTSRLSGLGYKGVYYSKLLVIHDTTDERRVLSDITLYYLFRNMVITHRMMSTLWWWIIVLAKSVSYSIFIVTTSKRKNDKLKTLFTGLWDGINYREKKR